jgi:hypothetical protein
VRDGRLIVYDGASHASAMTSKRLGDDVATFLLPSNELAAEVRPAAPAGV